jgi:hypothetical protein
MTTPVTGSTVDSRAAALALFEGQVPCFFSLADPPACPATARHLAFLAHEENTSACDYDEPWPVCEEHKRLLQMASHPFWRTWRQSPPIQCRNCGTPLRIERFEALGGGHG